MSDDKYGRVYTKFHRTKLIDEWSFASPHDRSGLEPLVAKIYITREPRPSTAITFEAFSKFFPERTIRNRDIEALRVEVEEAFRKEDLKRHGIEWEDWIEIETSDYVWGGNTENSDGGALCITYRILKRGTDPKTGKLLTILSNNCVTDFPMPKRAGEPDPMKKKGDWSPGRDVDHQYAYLPSTPANLAAIESVCQRLRDLHGRLNELLEQDKVADSLAVEWTKLPQLEDKRS